MDQKKTVLILGASSDIAVACARTFAQEKFDVLLAGRDKERFEAMAKDLCIRYGIFSQALEFDALDYASHSAFFHQLPKQPEVTLCIFGLLGEQEISEQNWDACAKVLHSNYTGAVSILNTVAQAYEKAGKGSIIGISSVAGDRGRMSNYIYGSAKAGFSAYLSGLRNRLYKAGVYVTTVKPGFVATKMTEELNLPGPLTASPEAVAKDIYRAYRKKSNTIYTKWFWRYIMLIITSIPENIFKKLKL